MERLPTESEWKDWKEHPVTRALWRWTASRQSTLKDLWASGAYTHENNDASWAANHAAAGACSAYGELADLDYGAFLSEFDEPERMAASGPGGPDSELPSGGDLLDHRDA